MNLFTNALLFDPQNISNFVLWSAGLAWLVVLLILIIDMFTNSGFTKFWKIFWLPLLIGLPCVGAFFYATISGINSWRSKK
jgi:hypothetical protein